MEVEERMRVAEALHNLRLAAIRGSVDGVRTTLAKGITVNQTLKGGWTALMYACSMAHPAVVEHLLQQGANPNFHKELFTPLMATCASTQSDEDKLVQCVDILLRYKALVNVAERHHITALMFASKEGRAKVVARLLASDCNCDIDAQDSQGWTALFWAVNQAKARVVSVLVKKGAKTDVQDRCGQTAIDLAKIKGLDQITDVLTKKNVPPNDLQPDYNNHNSSDTKIKYVFEKEADTMLQAFLRELSASLISNNGRCRNSFARFLNSMELENNLEVLKAHKQAISKITHSVNGCLKNSILSTNKYLQSPVDQTKSVEMSWKNIPYSAVEAREVLSQMVRHIEGLYATMSFVRLHMQGNPPAALVEDRFARISEITALSDKALQGARLLYDEIRFFHQYAKLLEESDCLVPADIVTEHKVERRHAKVISSCVIMAAVIVILFNNRVLTLSVFGK